MITTGPVATAVTGAAHTGAIDATSDPARELAGEAPEVAFLMAKYGVTADEAVRRLTVQSKADVLSAILDERLGGGYGGLWFDHESGDLVVAGAPEDSAYITEQIKATDLASASRFVEQTTTLSDLNDARERLDTALKANPVPGLSSGALSAREGRVTLEISAAVAEDSVVKAAAQQIAERVGALVVVDVAEGAVAEAACAPPGDGRIWCDAPLRGGVGISSATDRCSAGFNVVSRTDSFSYLLTAGHCGTGDWDTRFANLDVHNIGTTHNIENSVVLDAQIINLRNKDGWAPRPWVFVTGDDGQSYNESRVIDVVGTTSEGFIVCMTGRRGGTECGEVINRERLGAGNLQFVAEVRGGCIRGGDSGGPVYGVFTGFGIVHGGIFPLDARGEPDTTQCSITWLYQGLGEALSEMNVRLRTSSLP